VRRAAQSLEHAAAGAHDAQRPVFFENARELGRRVMETGPAMLDGRVRWLFELCLARRPQPEEVSVVRNLFEAELASYRADAEAAAALVGVSDKRPELAETARGSHSSCYDQSRRIRDRE